MHELYISHEALTYILGPLQPVPAHSGSRSGNYRASPTFTRHIVRLQQFSNRAETNCPVAFSSAAKTARCVDTLVPN